MIRGIPKTTSARSIYQNQYQKRHICVQCTEYVNACREIKNLYYSAPFMLNILAKNILFYLNVCLPLANSLQVGLRVTSDSMYE